MQPFVRAASQGAALFRVPRGGTIGCVSGRHLEVSAPSTLVRHLSAPCRVSSQHVGASVPLNRL